MSPASRGRRLALVAPLGLLATLVMSCSATAAAPAVPSPRVSSPAASSLAAPSPAPSAPAGRGAAAASGSTAAGFTVSGASPVTPSGSQDTYAATPGADCAGAAFAADQALGSGLARGFSAGGFPVAAQLLAHFLGGSGTAVAYRAGSSISRQARASVEFQAMNTEVQAAIASQLRAGGTAVRLSAGQLPRLSFASRSSDLYWGFRGTQGLAVTGHGRRENGIYVGALTYVIRDSYGFPAGDTLGGFGSPMRYLQTVCGAPRHAGGARWFPDSVTVTVPFRRPA